MPRHFTSEVILWALRWYPAFPDYETRLWRPALHKAFPHARLRRTDVHARLGYLRTFRNRIAQHSLVPQLLGLPRGTGVSTF